MHRRLVISTILFCNLIPGAVAGQEPDAVDAQTPDVGAPPIDVEPINGLENYSTNEAWALFDTALQAQIDGDLGAARDALNRLLTDHPEHILASRARLLRASFSPVIPPAPDGANGLGAPPGRGHMDYVLDTETPSAAEAATDLLHEEPTGRARAELIIFQTVHGMALGAEVCLLIECESIQPLVLLPMLGGGAALAASLFATRGGLLPGEASALNSGVLWGATNAAMIQAALDPDGVSTVMLGMISGQALGLGAGFLVNHWTDATAGQISFATSTGMWSGLLTFLTVAATSDFDFDPRAAILTTLAMADAGLVVGGFWARAVPMSRGRSLVIDAATGLGGLVGGALALLAETDGVAVMGGAAVGILGGFLAGYFLTQDWDAPDISASVSVAPTRGGAMAAVRVEL